METGHGEGRRGRSPSPARYLLRGCVPARYYYLYRGYNSTGSLKLFYYLFYNRRSQIPHRHPSSFIIYNHASPYPITISLSRKNYVRYEKFSFILFAFCFLNWIKNLEKGKNFFSDWNNPLDPFPVPPKLSPNNYLEK